MNIILDANKNLKISSIFDSRYLQEKTCKIILLGDGNVGKTYWCENFKTKRLSRSVFEFYSIITEFTKYYITVSNELYSLRSNTFYRYGLRSNIILIMCKESKRQNERGDNFIYPSNHIKDILEYRRHNYRRIPYMLITRMKYNSNLEFPFLIDQELTDYRKGILILQRIRLCYLLKKISYKYWYEVLNEQGLSRMCLKDISY